MARTRTTVKPHHSGTPWLPGRLPHVALTITVAMIAHLVWVRITGLPMAYWWANLLVGPAVLVCAQQPFQLFLGGGSLAARPVPKIVWAHLLFLLASAFWGTTFLLPVYGVIIAATHINWSGSRIWRSTSVATLLATVAGQALVLLGVARGLVTVPVSLGLAVLSLVAAQTAIADVALSARRQEALARGLAEAVARDGLTGVLQRNALLDRLQDLVVRARPGAAVVVLYVDLDGFKRVNDSGGHRAGDAVLVETARRLVAAVPPGAAVGRLGGDEFLVALPDVADPDGAQDLADAVRAAVLAPVDLPSGSVVVSASVGIAWTSAPGIDVDTLVDAADRAMYATKNPARNPPDPVSSWPWAVRP